MSLHPVPIDHFADTCLTRATVATALVWFAAREAAMYAEHIIDAGRREPLERLAHFLLEMLTRLQAIGSASTNSFVMPLSQEGIGDVIGLSAPHVNRMLAELRRDGLIAMKGQEIKILDRAALQILGEFHPTYLVRTPIRQAQPRNRPSFSRPPPRAGS
jgi:CRP-like cAMP-binding protein